MKKMITQNNLFEQVYRFENLYNSYLKARRGKNDSNEVLKFTYNLEHNLITLQKQLQTQTYKTGKYRHFTIYEPKKREISALPFRDRVIHHAIYNTIEPIFEKTFINESYACRKNKGTHAGANKIQQFLKNNKNSYALKCDIKSYFPSVNHTTLKKMIKRKISDKKLLTLLNQIIDSTETEKGIPIGNLTSQLFANIYLNKLDQFAKQELKAKKYVRYMDDFVLLHKSKTKLLKWKNQIEQLLHQIKLEYNKRKANIFPVNKGIDFLGYKLFAFHKLIRKSTLKRFLRKIKTKIKNYLKKQISFEKLIESFTSWEAYLTHGNSYALKKSIYRSCFKNVF
jgi:RNA-directed DNA polymerase